MGNNAFSFHDWRMRLRQLGHKASKAYCARLLGLDPHTYDKYEHDPQRAPAAYKLAAVAILMGYRYD